MDGVTIFLLFLVLILLGVGITFLVLWLINRNKKKENNPDDLSLTGLVVRLSAADTVTATWTNTGAPGNQVTIYADTQKIELDSSGKPIKATDNLLVGGPVNENVKTISTSPLKPNTKYFIDVVVTGDNRHKASTAVVWTGAVPTTEFQIEELQNSGRIELGTDNATVFYHNKTANKNNDDLWSYDLQTSRLTGNGSGGAKPVLYNNAGTLAATTDTTILTPANSEWVYNGNGRNRWCLKSSPNTCLQVSDLSSTNSQIRVTAGGESQWLNRNLSL